MSKSYYIIPIFVPHLGCPHNCVFCNQNKISGEEGVVDSRYVENTVEEYLKTIDITNSTVEISFFGGTFTAIPMQKQKELLEVAYKYKRLKKINYIRLSTRPDYIDNDILNHLKVYDVDIIELGVQSLDKEVLRKSARGHSEEDVRNASMLIKEYGFTLGHQIMLGLPGDTFEKDLDTANKSIEMKPDICRIYPALVIKDTPMEEMLRREEYKPYTLSEAVAIAKKIYKLYIENHINVIRVGLQPTENINTGGDIIDGPFHPAFRELVESSILNEHIYNLLKESKNDVTIRINNRYISRLYANKKEFFNELKSKLVNVKINVCIDDSVKVGEIQIDSNKETKIVSI
ncbi:elongator complex protein 3 [Clostridium folliculivorans]|uniref:Radical SAM protein n=1 Tax=Clostridium folliculivorans TaxID=2886038 RepID=A0A9W6DAF9_9CLOT|nr:radical SAM protein [Clostridium folliculivorans]GKU24782.1 radical SAM protein [Clostridium folliculivorans]GKU30880.1 radical SAM protein [Clostridium folliculivorans]